MNKNACKEYNMIITIKLHNQIIKKKRRNCVDVN